MAFASARGSGHPDEACDRVAEALMAEYVRRDPAARCDIRVMGGHGVLFVSGEVNTDADFDAGAVVRRSLGEIDPALSLEPFVTLERMDGMPTYGASEPVSVFGYACDETTERLPPPVAFADRAVAEIERLRHDDPDWYWCGADFEIGVLSARKAIVRVSHVPSMALDDIRMRVGSALSRLLPDLEWKVNPAGPDTRLGLAGRIGSSRQPMSGGLFGSALPSPPPSSGRHPSHPAKRGAELAREVAIELVQSKRGRACFVELLYLPDETVPHSVRIRNERGEDLSKSLDASRFAL